MLVTAGRHGATHALLSAHGDASVFAGIVNRGLATFTMEQVRANGKLIARW
jgi:hypothetical protein